MSDNQPTDNELSLKLICELKELLYKYLWRVARLEWDQDRRDEKIKQLNEELAALRVDKVIAKGWNSKED